MILAYRVATFVVLRFMMRHADADLGALVATTVPPPDLMKVQRFGCLVEKFQQEARNCQPLSTQCLVSSQPNVTPVCRPAGGKQPNPESSRASQQQECCRAFKGIALYWKILCDTVMHFNTISKAQCTTVANHMEPNRAPDRGGLSKIENLGIEVSSLCFPAGFSNTVSTHDHPMILGHRAIYRFIF